MIRHPKWNRIHDVVCETYRQSYNIRFYRHRRLCMNTVFLSIMIRLIKIPEVKQEEESCRWFLMFMLQQQIENNFSKECWGGGGG